MSTWLQIRRTAAALVAGAVALVADRHQVPLPGAVLFGLCAAVIFAQVIFPLIWRPPPPDEPDGRH